MQRLVGGLSILLVLGLMSLYGQHRLNQQQTAIVNAWSAAQKDMTALFGRTLSAHQALERQRQELQLRQQQRQLFARWVNVVRSLEMLLPPEVWLRSLKKNRQSFALQGMSHSISALHQFQESLRHQHGIQEVRLGNLRRESSGDISFSLHVELNERGKGECAIRGYSPG